MSRAISTPIVLKHNNIVPGSEVITIRGSSIPALIRDVDYIIDNDAGEIRFLTGGAASLYLGNVGDAWIGSSSTFAIAETGNVGIGTSSPSNKLDVIGGYSWLNDGVLIGADSLNNAIRTTNSGASSSTTMYIGNQSITTSSDERLKKDIVDSQFSAVDAINNIEIKDFSWDDPTDTSWNNRNARGLWTGFIAQQAIAHIPFMINAPRKEDTLEIDMESEAKWSVDTGAAIGVLMKAIQEHKTEKDTEIAELRARIEALEL